MAFKFPDFKVIAIGFIFSLIVIQVISLLISASFPSVDIIKGGNALLVMIVGIGIVTLFQISFNLESLKDKKTLFYILIIFGLIGLAFWKGPEYFPQIFSIEPNISESIKSTIGAIFTP